MITWKQTEIEVSTYNNMLNAIRFLDNNDFFLKGNVLISSSFASSIRIAINNLENRMMQLDKGEYMGVKRKQEEFASVVRKTIRIIDHMATNKYINETFKPRLVEIKCTLESHIMMAKLDEYYSPLAGKEVKDNEFS